MSARALKYAINREEIAKKIFLGHATPGNDNPMPPPPAVKFSVDPQPHYAYDPDKAKFHLKKAGLSTLKVDLSARRRRLQRRRRCRGSVQGIAPRRGIDINVVREPNDGYWDNVWLKKPLCASYWSGRPTVDWMFTDDLCGGCGLERDRIGRTRTSTSCSSRLAAETRREEAGQMYAEMQQLVHDDGGTIVLVFNNLRGRHIRRSCSWRHRRQLGGRWLKIAERWWFA